MTNEFLESDEPRLTPEEFEEVLQNARERLRLSRGRALAALAVFILGCGFLYLFLAGAPLHRYFNSVKPFLFPLWMAILIALVYYGAMWWGAWQALRDLKEVGR
jgi:uncharacterized RDD family membrane protein YckC